MEVVASIQCVNNSEMKTPRVRKKRKSDEGIVFNDEDHSSAPPPTKRPTRRFKAGKLAALIDMPIDVLFEIFGHLRPYDLLKMARMTKQFRHLLMDRSSKSVWKMALKQIPDLPPCPPEMCEPAWVNLAFDPHCHFCFTTGVRSVEWSLRIRICAKCAKEKIEELRIPGPPSCDDLLDFPVKTVLPSRPGKRGLRGVLRSEHLRLVEQYNALETNQDRLTFVQEKRAYISAVQKHSILCNAWALNRLDDRQSELQRIRNERYAGIVKNLKALGYAEDIESIRYPDALDDHELVKKPQKLTKRVWANIKQPLIAFMERMRNKRLAREHASLVLLRQLSAVAVLRAYKNEHLPLTEVMPEGPDFCDFPPIKTILQQPTETTVDMSSFSEILPLIPGLLVQWRNDLDDQIIRLLGRENTGAAVFGDYLEQGFSYDDAFDALEDLQGILGCDSSRLSEVTDDNTLRNRMKLATTVYQCTRCSSSFSNCSFDSLNSYMSDDPFYGRSPIRPMFYPNVLGHLCLTRKQFSPWACNTNIDPVKKLDVEDEKARRKWTTDPLRINRHLGQNVKDLVLRAGLDSETATADDMDKLGVWFACTHCSTFMCGNKYKKTHAFMWRDAVLHDCVPASPHPARWRKMNADEVKDARRIYETHVAPHKPDAIEDHDPPVEKAIDRLIWLCVHCRDTPEEREPTALHMIQLHLEAMHDIKNPELNQDYYEDYAAGPPSTQHIIALTY